MKGFSITTGLRAVRLLAAALLLSTVAGCATVRQTEALIDPVPVYIGDYGVHSGLFLPTTDDRYVEYLFGDWGYAVENRNMPQDAVGALTMSWGSAFGRMYHDPLPGRQEPNLSRRPIRMQKVMAERSDVYALIDRLDVRFEKLAEKHGAPVVNPETGVRWVRDERRYSVANNCNHLTAQSLRDLGCRVSGVVVWSKFAVTDPGTEAPPATPMPKRKPKRVPGWAAVE